MKSILQEKRIILAAVALLLVAYCGYWTYRLVGNDLQSTEAEKDIPQVTVVHAKRAPPTVTIALPGTIYAWFQASIYAQVSGYVKMWYKDYGAKVTKGDVLAELNVPTLDAQYAQAKADLQAEIAKYNLAVVTVKRFLAMRESHAVSEQSITVKEAELKTEEGKVNAARQNVRNFEAYIRFKTLISPYDGIVTVRNINVGDYVNKEGDITSGITSEQTKAALFVVSDVHMMRLFISVPSPLARFLKPGDTADVVVPQYPNRHFTANYLTTANGVDSNTRTVVVEFTLDNKEGLLWPNSYATVHLTGRANKEVFTIPSSSMVFDDHGTQVAVLTEEGRVHFKPIAIIKILDETIDVTEGVTEDDLIINNPSAALLEGDIVRRAPDKVASKSDEGEEAKQEDAEKD